MRDINKFRGCLLGGAIGDALGYSVEFLSDMEIFAKYGSSGITEYSLTDGVAQISDDTQMTLFTANGLLLGTTRGRMRGVQGSYPFYISLCYKDWLKTQTRRYPLNEPHPYSWLVNIPQLFSRRAPGNTCLTALRSDTFGTIERPANKSKGCGGIMRVAPIGIYFTDKRLEPEDIDIIGAEAAALTHGHELGYIPAAALVHIIYMLSEHRDTDILSAVKDSMVMIKAMFSTAKHINELTDLIQKAIDLAATDTDDLTAIKQLGEGWVAEETLAIAVYCSLKYSNSFEEAVIASVNHSGDSDSTGAVTGNIMGTYLGCDNIPDKYLTNLELKNIITELADDLYNDCQMSEYSPIYDEAWVQKYIEMNYRG